MADGPHGQEKGARRFGGPRTVFGGRRQIGTRPGAGRIWRLPQAANDNPPPRRLILARLAFLAAILGAAGLLWVSGSGNGP